LVRVRVWNDAPLLNTVAFTDVSALVSVIVADTVIAPPVTGKLAGEIVAEVMLGPGTETPASTVEPVAVTGPALCDRLSVALTLEVNVIGVVVVFAAAV
jgi:energy-converting hydrogenase Eha subunit E